MCFSPSKLMAIASGFFPKQLPEGFTKRGIIMKRILVLMLAISMLFCNMVIAASAEEELITFDNISSDGIADIAGLSDFIVSVDESIEVSSVELIADGVSLGEDTEAPFSFALDESTLGQRNVEAIVCDTSGVYYYAEKNFSLVQYSEGTLCSADFASYGGGAGNVSTSHWVNEQGPPTSFDRGDENGICLMISYPDGDHSAHNCNSVCDKWPQFRHHGNSTDKNKSSVIHFETDFCFDQPERGTGRGWSSYGWSAYGPTANGNKSNSILSIAASADGTYLKCAGQEFEINQQQWYRIVFEYDWKTGNTSLWVDEEQLIKNEVISRTNDITSLTWIQGGGNSYGGAVYFDNWDMWSVFTSPYGTGLADEAEKLTYTEESVTLGLTQGISLMEPTLLTLTNEIGEVEIQSADVSLEDKTITVTPVGGFLPSNTYELTIPTKTLFSGGEIAKPLKLRFNTTPEETDVVSGKIVKGADVAFRADVINTSGTPKTLTAYLCAFKNGVFYKIERAGESVSGDTPLTLTTPAIEKAPGMTYKAFVTDENGKPVTDKFYVLELN